MSKLNQAKANQARTNQPRTNQPRINPQKPTSPQQRQRERLQRSLKSAIVQGRTARVRELLREHPWLVRTIYDPVASEPVTSESAVSGGQTERSQIASGRESINREKIKRESINRESIGTAEYPRHYTPLHLAAIHGKLTIIELLIEQDADVMARSDRGRLPLYDAITFSMPLHHAAKMTRFLLRAMEKALPDERQRAQALADTIALLMKEGSLASFYLLVLSQAGADLEVRDHLGRSPLHRAVLARNVDAFDMLMELGVQPELIDDVGNTPLHLAVESGLFKWVLVVLHYRCRPLQRNHQGLSPYDLALQSKDRQIIERLERHAEVISYLQEASNESELKEIGPKEIGPKEIERDDG